MIPPARGREGERLPQVSAGIFLSFIRSFVQLFTHYVSTKRLILARTSQVLEKCHSFRLSLGEVASLERRSIAHHNTERGIKFIKVKVKKKKKRTRPGGRETPAFGIRRHTDSTDEGPRRPEPRPAEGTRGEAGTSWSRAETWNGTAQSAEVCVRQRAARTCQSTVRGYCLARKERNADTTGTNLERVTLSESSQSQRTSVASQDALRPA